MTKIHDHVRRIIGTADRLKAAAADTRPTFNDATRANFDHHVIEAFAREAKQLELEASELDALLEQAVRRLRA